MFLSAIFIDNSLKRTILKDLSANPIGVFDSGLGGLSVWQELVKLMPSEDIVYFADSGNCPYGNRTKSEIIEFSIRNSQFLIDNGAKIIVVACNTATGAAIKVLRDRFDIPFIGMEPAIKPAAKETKTKHIGVLATKGTLESELFRETKNAYTKDVTVHMQIGQGLVEVVENQKIEEKSTEVLLQKYLQPMLDNKVDKIVLGCTHYPFLQPVFEKLLKQNVDLINPAPAVAKQTLRQLTNFSILNKKTIPPKYDFYTSGDKEVLERFLRYIKVR